jgi:hypothetical protein
MKEKIRHLIAQKTLKKGFTKLLLQNLAESGKLTEEVQNHYLDELNALDEDIEMLKQALKKLN